MKRFFVVLLILFALPLSRAEAPQLASQHPQVSSYYPREVFVQRRKKLAEKIGNNIALILGAEEPDAFVSFRQNNTFFYFTGLEIPGAILWIQGKDARTFLYLPELAPFEMSSEGPRVIPNEEAIRLTGVHNVTALRWLYMSLASYQSRVDGIYTLASPEELGAMSRDQSEMAQSGRFNNPWDGRLSREAVFIQQLKQWFPAYTVRDMTLILDEIRWVKDEQEIRALKDCARIGVEGLKESIRATRPGVYEHELADVAHYVFMRQGAQGDAYFPVVASGPNSNYTHYRANRRRIEAGDLIVMDYAPDFQYEVVDITRTWPASGSFSPEQLTYYNCVLEAHRAVIAAVKPGVTPKELTAIARKIYAKHGMEKFFPGGIGHFVGMSVHDPGPYDRPFVAGVVFNVEPMIDVPGKKWHFRLEDTVLVTPTGNEVITVGLPWELDDIYKLRDSGSTLELKPR